LNPQIKEELAEAYRRVGKCRGPQRKPYMQIGDAAILWN